MAWNGSNSADAGSRHSRSEAKAGQPGARTNWKGLVAGLVVVTAGGLAAWLLLRDARPERPQPGGSDKAARIADVKPSAITNAVQSTRDYAGLSNWDVQHLDASETNKLTKAQLVHWKRHHPWPPPVESEQPRWSKSKTSIFEEKVNNDIAFVVGIEPGSRIFVMKQFDERFVKSFLGSIKRPIVITESDGDYEKALKRAVIDAKIELKAAYDRGEDIARIMNDSRDELMRLGSLKANLLQTARKEMMTNPGTTEEDAKAVVEAVNKMLESKGIAPIDGTAITRIAMSHAARKQAKENKQ